MKYETQFFAAPFFEDCVSLERFNEMNIEIIRNKAHKACLDGFYKFCENIGGPTADTMSEILEVWSSLYNFYDVIMKTY